MYPQSCVCKIGIEQLILWLSHNLNHHYSSWTHNQMPKKRKLDANY